MLFASFSLRWASFSRLGILTLPNILMLNSPLISDARAQHEPGVLQSENNQEFIGKSGDFLSWHLTGGIIAVVLHEVSLEIKTKPGSCLSVSLLAGWFDRSLSHVVAHIEVAKRGLLR